MRKIFILLVIVSVFSLTGCGESAAAKKKLEEVSGAIYSKNNMEAEIITSLDIKIKSKDTEKEENILLEATTNVEMLFKELSCYMTSEYELNYLGDKSKESHEIYIVPRKSDNVLEMYAKSSKDNTWYLTSENNLMGTISSFIAGNYYFASSKEANLTAINDEKKVNKIMCYSVKGQIDENAFVTSLRFLNYFGYEKIVPIFYNYKYLKTNLTYNYNMNNYYPVQVVYDFSKTEANELLYYLNSSIYDIKELDFEEFLSKNEITIEKFKIVVNYKQKPKEKDKIRVPLEIKKVTVVKENPNYYYDEEKDEYVEQDEELADEELANEEYSNNEEGYYDAELEKEYEDYKYYDDDRELDDNSDFEPYDGE